MNTPILDFVKAYQQAKPVRFHMPGHKGKGFLGVEELDITEISGADSLYEARGIIAESEKNASALFNSGATFYSTEGSSQCIKAMLYLLLSSWKRGEGKEPYIIAARNVHKAFLHGVALLDLKVVWYESKERKALSSVAIEGKELERIIGERGYPPVGVYLTSPDYLGQLLSLGEIAEICHKNDTFLAVDNAHGAYLHFLDSKLHPLDQGADICCDSAHKTLPVLTGGAYLHLGKGTADSWRSKGTQALALFGSTSPSYLTLISLDRCNQYLWKDYRKELKVMVKRILALKRLVSELGWEVENTEPLKLTVFLNYSFQGEKRNPVWMAGELEKHGIYPEYADPEYLVFMFSPGNTEEELEKLESFFIKIAKEKKHWKKDYREVPLGHREREQVVSIRQAMLSEWEIVPVCQAEGRICAQPLVSCPPAIPVLISGERISKEDIEISQYYGIDKIGVIKENRE